LINDTQVLLLTTTQFVYTYQTLSRVSITIFNVTQANFMITQLIVSTHLNVLFDDVARYSVYTVTTGYHDIPKMRYVNVIVLSVGLLLNI